MVCLLILMATIKKVGGDLLLIHYLTILYRGTLLLMFIKLGQTSIWRETLFKEGLENDNF